MKVNASLCVVALKSNSCLRYSIIFPFTYPVPLADLQWTNTQTAIEPMYLISGRRQVATSTRLLHLLTFQNYIHILSNVENSCNCHLQNIGQRTYLEIQSFFSVTPKSSTGFQRIKLVAKLREKWHIIILIMFTGALYSKWNLIMSES